MRTRSVTAPTLLPSVRMLGWLMVALLLAVAVLPVGAQSVSAAGYPTGNAANDPDNWEDEFEHPAVCYKHDEGQNSDHGYYTDRDGDDYKSYVLNTFKSSWPGDHWEALIVKAGTVNDVYVHPTAGVKYQAQSGKDISHVIVCKGTTPEPTPTPTPTPTPEPTPTPTPTPEPTPTPTPEPTPTPTPEPTPTPTPEPTPTPTPEPTPTPTPEPTPTPTPEPTPEPNEAFVGVIKIIDLDGDLETIEDTLAGEGWAFTLTVDPGTIGDSQPVTDAGGLAWWEISFDGDATEAEVTEVLRDGFALIDAVCVAGSIGEQASMSEIRALADEGSVGTLDGTTVSFPIDASSETLCIFVNSPTATPEDSVGGETATPKITLPPTDTIGGPAAPSQHTWRIMLVVLAGILASALVLTPSRPKGRRR